MARAEWYVIQVKTRYEEQIASRILQESALVDAQQDREDDPLLRECFSPRFITQRKRMGQWRDVERPLLPGYVIAVTADPAELARRLHRVPYLTRILTSGETYTPLNAAERAWLDEQTREDDRVVPMSFGYKVGDQVVVTEGPLVGREWQISRISRSKSFAHLELHVGGLTFKATVGFALLKAPEAKEETEEEAATKE